MLLWWLCLLWLLPLMFLSCSQSVTVVVVMAVVVPPDADVVWVTFGSAGLWRLVSIDWLCDLPVWLIGLGTYVINLLLFIYKLAGQRPLSRAFAPGSSGSSGCSGSSEIFNFHSETIDGIHEWWIDALGLTNCELSWAELSRVQLTWELGRLMLHFRPTSRPDEIDFDWLWLIYSVFRVKCKEIN